MAEVKLSDLRILRTSKFAGKEIHFIDQISVDKILQTGYGTGSKYSPRGRFIVLDSGCIEAIDNSDGCAFMEGFRTVRAAKRWLTDEDFDYEAYCKRAKRRRA